MKEKWKEKLKNLIESVIFCTWDCKNLDVDPPVTEKGMTLEETVKAKLPQFEKFINALLASQLKEVRSRIEALQQEFVGKMAIDALIKLSLELEAEVSKLAEVKEEK